MAVKFLQRVSNYLGALVAARSALLFSEDFLVDDQPDQSTTGTTGAEGALTGVTRIRLAGGTQVGPLATPALLSAVSTTQLRAGARAWVTYQGAWYLDPTSTATVVANEIITASGGGRWFRGKEGYPGAELVTVWEVSSVGLDTNAGTSTGAGNALLTVQEALRRIALQEIPANCAVNIRSDMTSDLDINVRVAKGATLNLRGIKTTIQTYVLSAVTNWSGPSHVVAQYTLTGAPNLTSLGYSNSAAPWSAYRFAKVTAGARAGAISPVGRDLTGGKFRGTFVDPTTYLEVIPVVTTDSVDIYSVTKLGGNVRVSNSGYGYVQFSDLDIGVVSANHSVQCVQGSTYFIGCVVRGLDFYQGCWLGVLVGCATFDCRTYTELDVFSCVLGNANGAGLSARRSGVATIYGPTIVQGPGLSAGSTSEGPGNIHVLHHMAVCDYAAAIAGVISYPGSTIVCTADLWVTATSSTTSGYLVWGGGSIRYDAGLKPAVLGTAPGDDAIVGGTAKAMAAIPYPEPVNGAHFVVNE